MNMTKSVTHNLPLYRRKKPGWHWRDVVRRQDEMTRLLKEFVSSATIQPDPNT